MPHPCRAVLATGWDKWQRPKLHPDHADQLLHRVGALLQGGLLFRGQLDLDDLLDAVRAQLARYADEQPVDTVFAFEIGGARRSEERRVGKECRSRWSPYH